MKPESKTTIKIGNAILNAEDLDHEDKVAIIELALHLAAPKIAKILAGSISKEIVNEEGNESREINKHDKLLFEMPEVLTVQEVADYMRVCKSKVYEMCRAYNGELFPNFKVGNRYKIPRNEFIEWLNMGGMHSFDKQIEDLRVKKKPNIIAETVKKEQAKPSATKSKTLEEAFADSADRLTIKRAADLLKVSKSTMRRLVINKKIFHYKLGERHYIIPTKGLDAYISSNGKATWFEQAENVGKYEVRIVNMEILSLPTNKHETASSETKCQSCKAVCWHDEDSEELLKESPLEYKVLCYKCAVKEEKSKQD